MLRKGSRLGKYRLDRRIGSGTFAEVWQARDLVEHRRVALKIVAVGQERETDRRAIEREARIAARLTHPNIVAVRNADWIDGRFVLSTDLAQRTLAAFASARRSAAVALRVIRDVAAGLAHAHAMGVLHLDLKPDNIMIFEDGRAAIGDFGISRFAHNATRTYFEAGTLGYLAPEQAYGRARLASDVFSLGLIAYQLVTGKLMSWPFDWPPPGHERFVERVPAPLQPVLRKAAAFDPGRRYPDGIALHRAVERAVNDAERMTRRRPPRRKPPEPLRPLALEAELFRRRHGARLGMVHLCHHCEGPIAETMTFCPWCGSADNSYREITRFPLVCPECERGVLPEWKVCPWCYAGRFVGNGRAPRHDPHAVRRCSRAGCGARLRPFMRYCPQCKQKPRRSWSHGELPDRCPRCRWPVSREFWRFCPWCGRREPRAGTFIGRGSHRAARAAGRG